MTRDRSVDERERFEEMYRAQFSSVLSYLLSRTDAETAKDVVADTFLVAWRRFADVPDDVRPWLFGVARNVLSTHRRASLRREALAVRAGAHVRSAEGSEADGVLDRRVVLGALEQLNVADREVLRLVAWDGLSYQEAAAVLGSTRTAFAVRLHRARRRFDAALADAEGAEQIDDLPSRKRDGGAQRPAVEPVEDEERGRRG